MLAKCRFLTLHGEQVERTPLLVPSFSSKGIPENVGKVLEAAQEFVEGPVLVSAYDVSYHGISPPVLAPLLFLDSGGYEASKDSDLSETGEYEHGPQEWTETKYTKVLAEWKAAVPTVIVSYDHPKEKMPVQKQIARARRLCPGDGNVMRELLIKPESTEQRS